MNEGAFYSLIGLSILETTSQGLVKNAKGYNTRMFAVGFITYTLFMILLNYVSNNYTLQNTNIILNIISILGSAIISSAISKTIPSIYTFIGITLSIMALYFFSL